METAMNRFTNKVVVITGAGNGIGAAAAKRFSSGGATVVAADYVMGRCEKIGGLPSFRSNICRICRCFRRESG